MKDLIIAGVKEGGNIAGGAVKGFLYLAGVAVGIIVVKYGADKALDVFNVAIDALKAIIS